jgi:hypothetical protein
LWTVVEETQTRALGRAPTPPTPAHAARVRAGDQWGSGVWQLAVLHDTATGLPRGAGATCKCHTNAFDSRVCKKNVTIGRSGLTVAELRLRCKRWLIAGLDLPVAGDPLAGDNLQEQHVEMGGTYMQDFARGLTEAECDRIANAQ